VDARGAHQSPAALSGFDQRTALAAAWSAALALIIADAVTWVQLDVCTIFGLPVMLAGAARDRRAMWSIAVVLLVSTFVVYALQVPEGEFTLGETFFVNRVLDSLVLLLMAGLLHAWMVSADTREAQSRHIRAQEEKIDAARASRRLVEVQEGERRILANNLHDLVGQKLTALSLNLSIIKSQPPPALSPPMLTRLDDSLALVEETMESIRDVMAELRPAVLDDFGLAPALRGYAENFARRTGIATEVIEEGAARRLPAKVEEALFRIAQEALANVSKYASAHKAAVTLSTERGAVRMAVSDDGCGFDPAAPRRTDREHGWGLMIMRERAATVAAELSVQSAPARGTRVSVTWTGANA
jgi:signal transduction histidine kinase